MINPIVIIPTYNELENIDRMVETVLGLNPQFDLLIVDDGSPDGTADVVKKWQAKDGRIHLMERSGKQGLGTAYIAGFKYCLEQGYDHIFEMDCDFSHNPEDLPKLYARLQEDDCDMVIGSRYVNNLVNVVNWPIGRVLMSYFASVYVRILTGLNIADTTAGFVGYKRKVLETIDLDRIRFKGYAFQIEMKYTTSKLGFAIEEVPIIFTDRTAGESKMSTGIFKEAIFGVIQMRLRKVKPKNSN
ncbi:polyprenol monophosphomannose synthase [bacterium]|nr:polyprenol monophosphomannose synthase [bacterium]